MFWHRSGLANPMSLCLDRLDWSNPAEAFQSTVVHSLWQQVPLNYALRQNSVLALAFELDAAARDYRPIHPFPPIPHVLCDMEHLCHRLWRSSSARTPPTPRSRLWLIGFHALSSACCKTHPGILRQPPMDHGAGGFSLCWPVSQLLWEYGKQQKCKKSAEKVRA